MTISESQAESVSSFVGIGGDDDQTTQMYMAVKGRKRKPSAKLLDVLQEDTEPRIIAPPITGFPELSLECAVAETVMNATDAGWMINPRSSPVLIEKIAAHVWRMSGVKKRQSTTPRRKISSPASLEEIVKPEPTAAEDETKVEEPLVPGTVDEKQEISVLDDHAAETAESKRKRGRPFKGQEKPIEERLLMETAKIRRLIEDVLRKNSAASPMCLKLRQIVQDIDSVMLEQEHALRMRPASRGLILSDDGHVLLVKFEFEKRGVFWAMPGGGREDNETFEEALVRELKEEVGLENFSIGPHIWNRQQMIPNFGHWHGQTEQIYLVKVGERFEPKPAMTWEQLNAENIFEIRWWSLDELLAAKDDQTEGGSIWGPKDLPELVVGIAKNGPPSSPIEIGV